MKWFGIMLMAALLALAPGFGSAQPAKSPATQHQSPEVKGKPAETAKSFTPAAKRAYEKKTAKELAVMQQRIADLRVKAADGSPQMKRMLIQKASRLQMRKLGADTQLAALKKASGTAWIQKKAELDKTMTGLKRSLKAQGVGL